MKPFVLCFTIIFFFKKTMGERDAPWLLHKKKRGSEKFVFRKCYFQTLDFLRNQVKSLHFPERRDARRQCFYFLYKFLRVTGSLRPQIREDWGDMGTCAPLLSPLQLCQKEVLIWLGVTTLVPPVTSNNIIFCKLTMAISTNRPGHRATDLSDWGPTLKKKFQHSSGIHITYYLEFNLGQSKTVSRDKL